MCLYKNTWTRWLIAGSDKRRSKSSNVLKSINQCRNAISGSGQDTDWEFGARAQAADISRTAYQFSTFYKQNPHVLSWNLLRDVPSKIDNFTLIFKSTKLKVITHCQLGCGVRMNCWCFCARQRKLMTLSEPKMKYGICNAKFTA